MVAPARGGAGGAVCGLILEVKAPLLAVLQPVVLVGSTSLFAPLPFTPLEGELGLLEPSCGCGGPRR